MSPSRAAAYIGSAVMLAAWLASAASTVFTPSDPQPPPTPVATSGTEHLASDVQAQSSRLRQRLAAAPVPQEPTRNPFAFGEREPHGRVPPAHVAAIDPPPVAVPIPRDPELSLIGIAEQQSAQGLVRTAMIVGAGDELYMVTQGQTLIGRYTVAAISPEVVELTDSVTGATRRLALR